MFQKWFKKLNNQRGVNIDEPWEEFEYKAIHDIRLVLQIWKTVLGEAFHTKTQREAFEKERGILFDMEDKLFVPYTMFSIVALKRMNVDIIRESRDWHMYPCVQCRKFKARIVKNINNEIIIYQQCLVGEMQTTSTISDYKTNRVNLEQEMEVVFNGKHYGEVSYSEKDYEILPFDPNYIPDY